MHASPCPAKLPTWLLVIRALLIFALVFLAVGSLLPQEYVPGSPVKDKALHFAGYAGVGWLVMCAIRAPRRRAICLLSLALLGVALEFAQIFVPGRAFEVADMAANGCGVFIAFHVGRLLL